MINNAQQMSQDDIQFVQTIIVGIAFALLMPFFVNAILLVFFILRLLWHFRKSWLNAVLQLKWFNVFLLYNLVVSVMNRNMLGILLTPLFLLLGIFFVYYRRYIRVSGFVKLLKILLLGSIVLAVYAFFVYAHYSLTHGYGLLYIFKYAAVQTRAEATFFNANYYGLYCVFMILTALYFIVRCHDIFWRRVSYVAIGMNLLSLLLTASRFFPITLMVAVVAMLIFIDKRWTLMALTLGAIVIGALIIKPELMPRLENLDYALEDRFDLWRVGLSIFRSQPLFGRGAMSYQQFYYLYTDDADMHAHSLYIDSLANYGVVGVGLLLGLAWPYIKDLYRFFKLKRFRVEFGLLIGFFVTVLFHGMIDFAVFWIQTGIIFLMITVCPFEVWRDLPEALGKEQEGTLLEQLGLKK
ncbi:O-antigen ligase family protein [Aerococcaceae bacterium DSM 111020]|nr:O-antigen ligase family protein [Aerococcaceae bacterium DSM 111020]